MPRYVIVTVDRGYLGPRYGAVDPNLVDLHAWVSQLDQLADGVATPERGRPHLRDQRVMLSRVAMIGERQPSRDAAYDAVRRESLAAYRRAAEWAGRGGVVAIALDHGDRGVVQLAPAGALEANRGTLQTIWLAQQGRHPRAHLGMTHETILQIGAVLRDRRVGHVELLSCRIGVGPEGRDMLDWLHVLWGVQVRALVGDLVVQGPPFGSRGDQPTRAWVIPPGAPRERPRGGGHGNFYHEWIRTPPTSPDLWQISVPRVPEVNPSLVIPPLP